jgi:hypothetical protein
MGARPRGTHLPAPHRFDHNRGARPRHHHQHPQRHRLGSDTIEDIAAVVWQTGGIIRDLDADDCLARRLASAGGGDDILATSATIENANA